MRAPAVLPALLLLVLQTSPAASQINLMDFLPMAGAGLHLGGDSNPFFMKILAIVMDAENNMNEILEGVNNVQCREHLREFVDGIKELKFWSLKMVDAGTKVPEGILWGRHLYLGNYDECLSVQKVHTKDGTFDGQYCLLKPYVIDSDVSNEDPESALAKFSSLQETIAKSKGDISVMDILPEVFLLMESLKPKFAICIPSSCSPKDFMETINNALERFNLDLLIDIQEDDCNTFQRSGLDPIDHFALILLTLFLFLIAFSTSYDMYSLDSVNRKQLYTTFSVSSNARSLFDTSTDKDHLYALYGIKVLSIVWLMVGQRYAINYSIPYLNVVHILDFLENDRNLWIYCSAYAMDTLLVLSGLLVSFLFLNNNMRITSVKWPSFYLHRLIRIAPLLAVATLFHVSLLNNIGSGPVWRSISKNDCSSAWWKVLSFFKNYDMDSKCVDQSWYLSVDMQLFWLSPLLLISLLKWPKNGSLILAASISFSWLLSLIISYAGEINPSYSVVSSHNERMRSRSLEYYPTHMRCGSWLLGFALGYVLHLNRTNNKISIRLFKFQVPVLWLGSMLLLLGSILCMRPILHMDFVYHRFSHSLFNSTHHLMWALGICMMVFLCATEQGGMVNWILSRGIWQPLSRLSLAVYLIHPFVQEILLGSTRTPIYYSHRTLFTAFIGDWGISFLLAIPICLMFQIPFIRLEKIFMKEDVGHLQENLKRVAVNGSLLTDTLKNEKDDKLVSL